LALKQNLPENQPNQKNYVISHNQFKSESSEEDYDVINYMRFKNEF